MQAYVIHIFTLDSCGTSQTHRMRHTTEVHNSNKKSQGRF